MSRRRQHPVVTWLWILCLPAWLACASEDPPLSEPVEGAYELTGGLWWDGDGFSPRSVHVADGLFTAEPVAGVAKVDLSGLHVLPAFGEAHNHNVDSPSSFPGRNAEYLEQGIFYVKNPNHPTRLAQQVRALARGPETLDVALSNAGLTSPGGHPEAVYRSLGERGVYLGTYGSVEELVADARWAVTGVEELRRAWPRILEGEPDFIKLYLLDSDGRPAPSWGLSPPVFRAAVSLAHDAGLPVSVHVNTAADFELAVEAGADEINHLPGRLIRPGVDQDLYRISPELAGRAAKSGVVVVTTAIIAERGGTAESLQRSLPVMEANLDVLLEAGVPLALGSDDYFTTSLDEAEYLHRLGFMTPAQLLHSWAVVAPRTIFPDRAVGGTAPGDEASFVALACDPLADFACVRRIRASMKQGRWIEEPAG